MSARGRGRGRGRKEGPPQNQNILQSSVVVNGNVNPAANQLTPKPAWGGKGISNDVAPSITERNLENVKTNNQPSNTPNNNNQFTDALASKSGNVPDKPAASANNIEKSVAKLNDFKINGNRAKRPGYGTMGYRKIDLLVNYFKLNVPTGMVHQYDVDIEKMNEDKPNSKPQKRFPPELTRKIFEKVIKDSPIFKSHLPVYDGNKIVITKRSLGITKPQSFSVTVDHDFQIQTFDVTIKPSRMKTGGKDGEINLDDFHRYVKDREGEMPAEAIKAVDLVFKHGPSLVYHPVGKSFFRKPRSDEVPPHSEGRQIWFGYNQSVRPTEWQPVINIDLTATTYYEEGPCLDFLGKIMRIQSLNEPLKDWQLKRLTEEIRGLKVKATHNSAFERKFRVVGATRRNADQLTFLLKQTPDSKEIQVSIKWYFEQRYKVKLRYPHLPCLQMQPKEKNIYIPIECCRIMPDQHCRKKLSESLTAKMIKETLRTPKQRFKEISDNVRDVHTRALPYLKEFGIEMSTDPLQVQGRVLNPPKIVYSATDKFVPRQGVWDLRDHKFLLGATIDSWAILNFGSCNKNDRDKLAVMLERIGQECGIQFSSCRYNEDIRETRISVLEILKRLKVKIPDLQMVVVILPPKRDAGGVVSYEEVKQACDTELGIVTQCVKDINISRKCNPQLISNLCQKINAKMGGVNNATIGDSPNEQPALLNSPVIIMGADVTHPAPGSKDPSIAAVVGSLDRHMSKFAARIKVQKKFGEMQSRVEIILELKEMVSSLLKCFYTNTKKKPLRIVFYRDGVSEGQFSEVCSYEINQIKQACQELGEDYKPLLTFIVVQKRHSTRFCPKNDRDGMGKAGNVPPGTTVDRGIVSPIDFDFYLCSHFGLQGTSKPTHYTVLWDESHLSADEVQMLSYYLCHTYSRCTRSISLPAPVQYAHLAAFRARAHIKKVLGDGSSNGSSQNSQKYGTMVEIDDVAAAVAIEDSLKDRMYFV